MNLNEKEDHNSLLFWYPKILGRVPTPDTTIIPIDFDVGRSMDGGIPKPFLNLVKKKAEQIGYPVFMRTETLSAKHQWDRTCYVKSAIGIEQHLYELFETQLMLDMSGVPPPTAVILREFLHLKSFFTAYAGMPVAREFRFFATKGKIDCFHPYWPHGALEQGRPSILDWRKHIEQLEAIPEGSAFTMVERASNQFEEQMSIDVCQLEGGNWVLTDMALGKQSYHWDHDSADGGSEDGE